MHLFQITLHTTVYKDNNHKDNNQGDIIIERHLSVSAFVSTVYEIVTMFRVITLNNLSLYRNLGFVLNCYSVEF